MIANDRMACALTAIALIERPDADELHALIPDTLEDAQRVLASAVVAAHLLASQLAHLLGVDRSRIIEILRKDIASCFTPRKDTADE